MSEPKPNESALQDLSIAVMNLVSLEEHLQFSYSRTSDPKFLERAVAVREIRREAMRRLLGPEVIADGEMWCAMKHVLAASMRLLEVSAKSQPQSQKELCDLGVNLWALALSWLSEVPSGDPIWDWTDKAEQVERQDQPSQPGPSKWAAFRTSLLRRINCCIE